MQHLLSSAWLRAKPGRTEADRGGDHSAQPDILFVAFGAPKQEYWIYEHGLQLSVPVCIGVGGSFEIVGGVVPARSQWTQNIGCEWLYRLCREPRRMWRRYLIGNLEFAAIVLRQRIRRFSGHVCALRQRGPFAAELSELALQQRNRPFEAGTASPLTRWRFFELPPYE